MWIRLPRHKWPKSWSSMEDPVVPLERNLYGHPLAGLSWERQFEQILLKHGWEKIPNCECLFVHREQGLFLSVYVDAIKLAGKKQNLDPMWKLLNTEVDLGEPTSFLDHVYLGCTLRQCQISKDIVDNYRTIRICTMFLQKWISNLQDLPRSQSLETVPVCIVWQYFPHDNIVCIHTYDEYMKSIDSGVCHRPWSIL